MATDQQRSLSVIVPTLNRAGFITEAVRSIESQGYEDLEIIIVDDGSTDETANTVAILQRKNPDILFLANERARGPSGARNTGLQASSGRYVAFLDSDDVWLQGHVRRGIDILESNPKVDVLFGNFTVADYGSGKSLFNFFDEKPVLQTLETRPLCPGTKLIEDNLFGALVHENFFSLGSSICRREALDGVWFDEKVVYGEDRDFAIKLYVENKARFAFREEPVFVAYRHASSLTHYDDIRKRRLLMEAHVMLFSKYLRNYPLAPSDRSLVKGLLSERLLDLAYWQGLGKEYGEGLRSIGRSCRYGRSTHQPVAFLKLFAAALRYGRA